MADYVTDSFYVLQKDALVNEYMQANEELNQIREKMKACAEQISALDRARAALQQDLADCIVKIKRLDNEVCFSIRIGLSLFVSCLSLVRNVKHNTDWCRMYYQIVSTVLYIPFHGK